MAACPSGMFDAEEETSVTLGGETFTFGERKSYTGCQFVCGGFTGLHRSGKWSTWSPGRYRLPEDEKELLDVFFRAVGNYSKWPERTDGRSGYVNMALSDASLRLSCASCQLVCWGDKAATRENYRLLTKSGCVLQREGGDSEVLSSEEATREFDRMPASHKSIYE